MSNVMVIKNDYTKLDISKEKKDFLTEYPLGINLLARLGNIVSDGISSELTYFRDFHSDGIFRRK